MNRRQVFYNVVVLVIGTFAFYQYGRLVGRAEGRERARAALEAMAQNAPLSAELAKSGPPDELDGHRWVGRMEARVGGLTFDMMRYSMFDSVHREWNSMACVDAGRGLEVSGRWDPEVWWVSAHDADHPFPESIRIPVRDIPDTPVK